MDNNNYTNLSYYGRQRRISKTLGGKLSAYNRYVLEHQDEIYTFVFILLNNEDKASRIVQQCFFTQYRQSFSGNKITLRKNLFSLSIAAIWELLTREDRSILKQQESEESSRLELSQDNIALLVSTLPLEQSLVISLIDIIGMNYEEAAEILVQPMNTITRNLACARYGLSANSSIMK